MNIATALDIEKHSHDFGADLEFEARCVIIDNLRAERDLQFEKIQELEYELDAYKSIQVGKVMLDVVSLQAENKKLKDKIAEFIYNEDHPDEVEKCEQCEDEFGGELVDGRCRNCRDNDFDKYGGRK